MSILSITRLFTTLLSLLILAAAIYLLSSWYAGEQVRDATGALYRQRDSWRLWTGLGLVAWSSLGRYVVLALTARRDQRATKPERSNGRMVASPTGSSLYVETHGPEAGPPIIFTHGWGMDSTFWCYARQDLSDRFRLVLWDLPGLGKSKAADKNGISLEAFASDLATLLDTVGSRKPVLVGHSIGGMTIQTLLRDHPDLQSRIAGLVLLNTTYTNPLKTMIFSGLLRSLQRPVLEPASKLMILLQPLVWLSKWQSYLSGSSHLAQRLGFGAFATRSQLEHTTLLTTRNPPAAQARGDLAMFHWDATGVLGRARVPVLIVGGDKDIVTKLEASEVMAEEGEKAELQVVHGVNHMGPMERADLYNRLIADFALHVQPSASTDLRGASPAEMGEKAARRSPDWPDRPGVR